MDKLSVQWLNSLEAIRPHDSCTLKVQIHSRHDMCHRLSRLRTCTHKVSSTLLALVSMKDYCQVVLARFSFSRRWQSQSPGGSSLNGNKSLRGRGQRHANLGLLWPLIRIYPQSHSSGQARPSHCVRPVHLESLKLCPCLPNSMRASPRGHKTDHKVRTVGQRAIQLFLC